MSTSGPGFYARKGPNRLRYFRKPWLIGFSAP
jgi:hypothetical protein